VTQRRKSDQAGSGTSWLRMNSQSSVVKSPVVIYALEAKHHRAFIIHLRGREVYGLTLPAGASPTARAAQSLPSARPHRTVT
jgi:hypothetical protein